ncbi:organic hydroperoxide resistance protein [Staphylococcus aureus]|uniref:organic hydroperoxide resistance protein n=1 Tax=Staphylococcus aureus TaxID=1280 RepID=UPI0018EB360B|nr:organic hydroperoxide resistance protein [Staphylococcus aureus]MBJ6156655.1 organic hydroperoxide resistance protein [Staphylococcus aureus]
MEKELYSTTMVSNGGREGRVFSLDNTFVHNLATPKELGGKESLDTNPEQLFAAGYSACFNSALSLILNRSGVKDANPEVEVTVNLLKDEVDNGFKLGINIKVTLENLSDKEADVFVEKAHQFCPYSKATKNNIETNIEVITQ